MHQASNTQQLPVPNSFHIKTKETCVKYLIILHLSFAIVANKKDKYFYLYAPQVTAERASLSVGHWCVVQTDCDSLGDPLVSELHPALCETGWLTSSFLFLSFNTMIWKKQNNKI